MTDHENAKHMTQIDILQRQFTGLSRTMRLSQRRLISNTDSETFLPQRPLSTSLAFTFTISYYFSLHWFVLQYDKEDIFIHCSQHSSVCSTCDTLASSDNMRKTVVITSSPSAVLHAIPIKCYHEHGQSSTHPSSWLWIFHAWHVRSDPEISKKLTFDYQFLRPNNNDSKTG